MTGHAHARAALALCLTLCATNASAACSFFGITGLSFGGYVGGPTTTVGAITYVCTGLGGGAVVVDLGPGSSGVFVPRTLRSGGLDVLNYNLYLDPGLAAIWGDGTGGTSHYGPLSPPDAVNQKLDVYGYIPGGQNVSAGSYADSVIVTVNY